MDGSIGNRTAGIQVKSFFVEIMVGVVLQVRRGWSQGFQRILHAENEMTIFVCK